MGLELDTGHTSPGKAPGEAAEASAPSATTLAIFGLVVDLVLVVGLLVAVCLGKLGWTEAGPIIGALVGARVTARQVSKGGASPVVQAGAAVGLVLAAASFLSMSRGRG